MNKFGLLAGVAVSGIVLTTSAAFADQLAANQNITIEQAASYFHFSTGNDRVRVEIAPNYSEELGWSVKGVVGGYVSDEIALGMIVEYGENKREYLGNAGIQFTDALSLVGTVGMLEEHNEYVAGSGRETVQQMEYGVSLKGAYHAGIVNGFELNGYITNSDADSANVETAKLYGIQMLANLNLSDSTYVKLGGGYEWLQWDNSADNEHFTFTADATQRLGDAISINGMTKLGASEYVYGGGVALDVSNGGMNTNTVGVNYRYIDGKNGVEDDQRVELSWSIGFGAGPTTSVAAADITDTTGAIRPAADLSYVAPANDLLNDVTKRPAFLPERVLARKVNITSFDPSQCSSLNFPANPPYGMSTPTNGTVDLGVGSNTADGVYAIYFLEYKSSNSPVFGGVGSVSSNTMSFTQWTSPYGFFNDWSSQYVTGGADGFWLVNPSNCQIIGGWLIS